ncbi:MAG: hypothetical protein WBJ83_09570 [Thermacetogeniaceae bacterium]
MTVYEALADDLNFFASMDGVKIDWSRGLGYEIKEAGKTNTSHA